MRHLPLLCLAFSLAACSPPASPPAPSTASHATSPAPQKAPIEVAVTVDDLPLHGPAFRGVDRVAIADRMIAAFKRHAVPEVFGFVNAKKVDDARETEAVLRRWVDAGYPLGNHSYSHPSLHASDVTTYLADIEKGETLLARLSPQGGWKVFRYPFLFEGETLDKFDAVRGFLGARGYTIAEVTIDADDWAYNAPFARCSELGDRAAIAELRRGFVEGHVEELSRVRELSRALVGREVRHVLLLHIGAADADAIDDLLTAYEAQGVRFIGLREALADPFYASDRRVAYRAGAALPYVLAKMRGIKPPAPVFARGLEERLDRVCR